MTTEALVMISRQNKLMLITKKTPLMRVSYRLPARPAREQPGAAANVG